MELADACVRSGEEQLRAMAEVGCRLVLAKADFHSPAVAEALKALLAAGSAPVPSAWRWRR